MGPVKVYNSYILSSPSMPVTMVLMFCCSIALWLAYPWHKSEIKIPLVKAARCIQKSDKFALYCVVPILLWGASQLQGH